MSVKRELPFCRYCFAPLPKGRRRFCSDLHAQRWRRHDLPRRPRGSTAGQARS